MRRRAARGGHRPRRRVLRRSRSPPRLAACLRPRPARGARLQASTTSPNTFGGHKHCRRINSRRAGPPAQTKGADVEDGHPLHRQDPLREDGRRALVPRCHRPGRYRDLRGARARRGGARRGAGRRLRPGAAGRPGTDPLASGPDQGRHPARGPLGDRQQGLRLRHALDRDRRPGDPGRRPRDRRHRRDGVDEPGSLPAARRPLRLPDGRRHGDRLDDPRRPHQSLHREADDQRGQRGLERARDHPRRHGPLRGALPPARSQGDRGRQARGGDRHRDRQVEEGRERGRRRRGDPARTRPWRPSPS